jgi:CelD/BcsL family acetyltransferase involved in cellulose biosynthesis
MNIRTLQFEQLTSDDIAAWADIQSSDPTWASPFFRPEFAAAIAEVRGHVEVAILEENGEPVGFFPFERRSWGRGLPVGTRLSDYQGVVARQHVRVDPIQLMRACGLSSWTFDHLIAPHQSFDRFTFRRAESPCADLSGGYDAYEQSLSKGFRAEVQRKFRKLEREVGPVRVELNERSTAVFETLLRWKTDQYRRTKVLNILRFSWVRELLERLLHARGDEFSVMMPTLYAGDKILAVGYLLRSTTVLHSWFTSYDREFAPYSVGIHQHISTIRAAAEAGIKLVDMGKGTQQYKHSLSNKAIHLSEGVVDPIALRAGARSAWWALRTGLRASPVYKLIKQPMEKMFQLQGWLQLR